MENKIRKKWLISFGLLYVPLSILSLITIFQEKDQQALNAIAHLIGMLLIAFPHTIVLIGLKELNF